MKYYELPDGRMLQFPDDATDKAMQRAVRKELGMGGADILEEISNVSKQLANMQKSEGSRQQIGVMTDAFRAINKTMEQLVQTLDLQSFNQIKEMSKASEGTAKAVVKAFIPLQDALSRMQSALTSMYKGMETALDQSAQAIQADLNVTRKSTIALEQTVKDLTAAVTQLTEMHQLSAATARLRKRAYRNTDGSWTMEVIDRPVRMN